MERFRFNETTEFRIKTKPSFSLQIQKNTGFPDHRAIRKKTVISSHSVDSLSFFCFTDPSGIEIIFVRPN
ncbi:hypothetical protein [Leptospira mayottensis]|uniref:hypothetical protein n=1 Tax=Leptospira mayottensis TaxID=1137606 RepID=UPI001C1FD83D|nr:hypothetical protein [Leptospira mayottensis]